MIDINILDERGLCQLFDHTYLKAYAVREDFVRLCTEAKENHFRMVAINSYPVALCKELLQDSNVHVGAAISFPLGQMSIEGKCAETKIAIRDGA
ncbi:MAG: deoxyribose-phosphate aldolase, partial [Erysipelotrichaceae bacterium]|nr:deoxyribose-phosphate aldolase [Erysipelotrichaceae bacterium]